MKKVNFKRLLILIFILTFFPTITFAYGGIDTDIQMGNSDAVNSSVQITNRIVGVLQTVGTIISVIALIIIGMRYMFSSIEEKAQMKGVLIYYIIGCVLVFATSNVLAFVYDVLDDVQHNYEDVAVSEGGIKQAPTCVSTGIQLRKCKDCGKIIEVDIPIDPDAHNPGEWAYTKETCTTDGKKVRTCTYGCGYYEQEIVEKLGHNFERGKTITEPTCTTAGEGGDVCTICNLAINKFTIAATGHSSTFNEKITKQANCTEEGVKTYTCKNECGYSYTETIAATGHSTTFNEKITKKANCTEEGVKTYTCKNECGYSYTETIAATGHSTTFEEEITKQANCTEEGVKTYTCKNKCGYSYTKTIAATGHSYKTITTQVTCTTDGETYKLCSNCGNKTGITTIKALGHSYGDWSTTAATCTTNGSKTHTCSRCSGTESESIPALGHSLGTEKTNYTPIGETGAHTYDLTCTKCSHVSHKNESCSYKKTGEGRLSWGSWFWEEEEKCSYCGHTRWV